MSSAHSERPTPSLPSSPTDSLFARAARVFDGWTDAETGLGVLRLATAGSAAQAGFPEIGTLHTCYHQYPPFLDGGTRVSLNATAVRSGRRARYRLLLDLTTGALCHPYPEGHAGMEYGNHAGTAVYTRRSDHSRSVVLWDVRADREIAAYTPDPDWHLQEAHLLADGRTVLFTYFQGAFPHEKVNSRLFVMDDRGAVRELQATEGYFINHLQGCPTDPHRYAYDKWPTPMGPVDQVIHIATLDGSEDAPMRMLPDAVRPGSLWGGQRDHYLWTPDGTRIVSYVSPLIDPESTDHYDFGWWVSAVDWRSGEDLCVEYPAERWGGNFAVSPDSRFIATAGGRGFQKLYLIDIEGLRHGWNERVLCSYPYCEEDGHNHGPFHMPWVLPDQSGVLFCAGWPDAATDGTYLVEWPRDLRS